MTTHELIDLYSKTDRRTKDAAFAFLVDIVEEKYREQLSYFLKIIIGG